ncbi:MAG: energy transducer TonB [Bacteroidetes bacterium]|nr:energy transducer TonB [Bacteroidota bacterium]
MSEELKHTIYSSTDCLSEKVLFDYIDNNLSQKERHTVEKHLLDCELCSDALEGLESLKDRNRITQIKDTINKRIIETADKDAKVISINYKIIFSVAATIALLVVGVFFFDKISKKESVQSDMAELKKVNDPAPVTSAQLEEKEPSPSETTAGKATSGDNKSTNRNVVDQEIALSEKNKSEGGYYKTPGNNEGLTKTEEDFQNQVKVENLKDEANKTEGAEQIHDIVTSSTVQSDDRTILQTPVTGASSKNGAADREKDSKLEQSKKAGDNGAGAAGETYAWKSTPAAPSQNQNNKNSGNVEQQKLDLVKKSEKSGKYRAESKAKDKAVETKENTGDEEIALGGNSGNNNNSVLKNSDESKPDENGKAIQTAITDSTEQIFTTVDQMPEFIGGKDSLIKFISKNYNYANTILPETKPSNTKIYVQFVVGKDGVIRDQKILKGINGTMDKEALRVIKMMPKWKPGKQNGKAVSVSYIIPIQVEIK